jgi:hypothetical protein
MRTGQPSLWIAAFVLACAAGNAAAVELGTLFNSAEERARLDKLRRGEPLASASTGTSAGARELTGFVKRSDGRSTVFIDGVPMPVSNARAAALLEPEAVRGSHLETLKVERKPAK